MKIYRGLLTDSPSQIQKNNYLTKPRLPRDTSLSIHNVADKWFYDHFGIKGRSECIFCSSSVSQAREYGKAYEVLLPVYTEYFLIYSSYVKDFIEIEFDISDVNNNDLIRSWLENKSYQLVDSVDKLPDGFEGEVMLYCEFYEILEV